VAVADVKIRTANNGKRYACYKIVSKTSSGERITWRRFCDFESFNMNLIEHGLDALVLPGDTPLKGSKFLTPKYLEERRLHFERVLQAVVHLESHAESLEKFLGIDGVWQADKPSSPPGSVHSTIDQMESRQRKTLPNFLGPLDRFPSLEGKRILVVDDDRELRSWAKKALESARCSEVVAFDSAEASILFRECAPKIPRLFDAVLLDWASAETETDGVSLSKAFRDAFRGTQLRIFLLRRGATEGQCFDGLHVLPKPLDLCSLDGFCAVPGQSLWGPGRAHDPPHIAIEAGSPRAFDADRWRATHGKEVSMAREGLKTIVPGGQGVGGFKHTRPHDDPHGMRCGMSQQEMHKLEGRFVMLATVVFFFAAVSCFTVFAAELRKDDPSHLELYVATTLITTLAFLAYLAKAGGQGYLTLPNGTTICHVRYMDWLFTTPLLLYDLCDLSGASPAVVMFLIFADLLMIGLGMCAMISQAWKHRVMWYFMSSIFYTLLLYGILGPLDKAVADKEDEVVSLYSSLKWIIVISWSLYPIVVMLGPSGIAVSSDGTVGYFGHSAEAIIIVVLDIVAKVGFEALILFSAI
jgi:bacteriorhodopsin